MQLKNTFQAIFYTIILISVTATLFSNLMNLYSLEIDETAYVTEFIDGDSFKVQGDEVRLADVSAPEYYEEGGTEASEALRHLLDRETLYLDTDQKGGRDPYGARRRIK